MLKKHFGLLLCCVLAAGWTTPILGQEIAATVDGEPIEVREVQREVERAANGRQLEPSQRELLTKHALRQLVNRRLILRYLKENKLGASDADVQLAQEQAVKALKEQGMTLTAFLKDGKQTEAQFRRSLAWQVGWGRYLEKYTTDENLQRYFAAHREQFNGTELEAAHILLKVVADAPTAQWEQTNRRAAEIRAEIAAGKLSFEQAAEQYSQAPTASDGGAIGRVPRRGLMPESFSAALFALKDGEISPPVETTVGVHLIRRLRAEPGQKRFEDVRGEVTEAVTKYLFEWVADQQRPHSQIEYTGVVSQSKPGE